MDLFRRKQKLIFWIVTIIIVPSFVLVWGYNRSPHGGGGGDGEMAKINGQRISYGDFQRFRSRFIAAIGEQPFKVAGAMPNQAIPGLWDFLWVYYLVGEAEKAGVVVSDAMVGTYIRQSHPAIAQKFRENPALLDDAVNSVCLRNQISRGEFMRGVKEWLAVRKYIELETNTIVADQDSAYILYALDRSEFDFKRLRVEANDAIREQAKKEVMEKPAAELEATIRTHIESKSNDPRYRDPATWRFAYVLVPFASGSDLRPATDREIQAQYDTYKSTRYAGKTFEEAREAVVAELAKQERERQTLRNLDADVDPQLREHGAMDPAELAKLTPLAKHGVKAGDTGPDPVTAVQIATGGPFGPVPELASLLNLFDSLPAKEREEEVKAWESGTGYLLQTTPIRTDAGFLRLRLLAYNPSKAVEMNDAEGKIKPQLFETALADLVADRVSELTREKAETTQTEITQYMEAKRTGGDASPEMAKLLDGLPVETKRYRELVGTADYEFGRMGVGEVRGPLIVPVREGPPMAWDVVVLTERRVPNRASFAAEPESVRTEYAGRDRGSRAARIGYSFDNNMLVQTLQPSETMLVAFWDKYLKRQISINRDLEQQPGS